MMSLIENETMGVDQSANISCILRSYLSNQRIPF